MTGKNTLTHTQTHTHIYRQTDTHTNRQIDREKERWKKSKENTQKSVYFAYVRRQ